MLILALFLAVGAFAQDPTACLECHADQAVYGRSIHKDIGCSGCHQTILEFPHPEQENGERSVGRSRIVTMCGRCHGDLKFVEDRRIPGRQLPFINYADSVHGRAVAGGRLEAAICTDCHGSHDARPPSDPQSKVSRSRAHATCGACHSDEFEQYEQSVHGQAHREGQSGAPTCTDCHGIHFSASLRGPRPDPGFPGYVEKLEYWALLWGTVIMAVTGLLLWFENTTLRVVPLWVLNLLTVIHYYEAVLATSAILVWHIYFVVLDPTVYPLKSLKREKAPDL